MIGILLLVVEFSRVILSALRNERARWISALGQNPNNKDQDRSSKFEPLWVYHIVPSCGYSVKQLFKKTVYATFCLVSAVFHLRCHPGGGDQDLHSQTAR